MSDCLFCKIVNKEIPAKIVYEDDLCLVFEDIHPQAPIHFLAIPKKHIKTFMDLGDEDSEFIASMIKGLQVCAEDNGLNKDGFRTVINNGKHGGQEVYHVHMHLLGGRQMDWPPG
ncbi:MAG: histidine triad nucleotide-binding protein [Pseudomonadota bacterium]